MDVREELETLVAFNTVNSHDDKIGDECAKHINNRLEEHGFRTELLESDQYYTAFGRYGQGAFKILFLAHYDVVPTGDDWKTEPFKMEVDGDRAYGRGTCDDKGNIVSLLLLAERLKEEDLDCMVMISATGDEEIGGRHGAGYLREYLQKNGLYPDYVVIADGIGQKVIHRRRNILPTYIKVKQKRETIRGQSETIKFTTDTFESESRHSAYIRPGVDRHAMLVASKYLELNHQVSVQTVRGSFIKGNVVPDWVELDIVRPADNGSEFEVDTNLTALMKSLLAISATHFPVVHSDIGTMIWPNLLSFDKGLWTLYCDIRAMTNNGEEVQAAFEKTLKDKVDLFSLKVHSGVGYVESDRSSKLMRSAVWALEKEGIDYEVIEGFGGSDSRYFAADGTPLFDFGPQGDNLHGPNEWVSLSSLEESTSFFHRLIKVLLRQPEGL